MIFQVTQNNFDLPSLTLGYALNPTTHPKRIDFANISAPPMTSVCGIYELKGDRLTMCFRSDPAMGMGGGSPFPPARLAASSKTSLIILKRISKPAVQSGGQAPSPKKPKEAPLQFGPVIERVVNARSEGKGSDAINLASGKLVDLPKDFDKWTADKQRNWCAENKVDLLGDVNPASNVGIGASTVPLAGYLTPEELKLAAIPESDWNSADNGMVSNAVFQLYIQSATPGHAFYPEDINDPVAEIHEQHGVTVFELRKLPATFAFQTRKGQLGLLQVLRYTEEPRGLRIRYKLRSRANKAARRMPQRGSVRPAQGNALGKRAQPNLRRRPNGPTVWRTLGPLGRQVRKINSLPQGRALGWANRRAFGPQNPRLRPSIPPPHSRP